MAKDGELTEKQRRFVEAYMGEAHGNASEAARMAGCSDHNYGRQLLMKDKIRRAIAEIREGDPLVASRKEIQAQLTAIVMGMTPQGYEGLKPGDRLRGIELLGKMTGEFLERVQAEVQAVFVDPGEAESVEDWEGDVEVVDGEIVEEGSGE